MSESMYPAILPESQPAYTNGDVVGATHIFDHLDRYDRYDGPLRELQARVVHVGVRLDQRQEEKPTHVIKFAVIENPYLHERTPQEKDKGRTFILYGGGTADGIGTLGMAARLFDADNITEKEAPRITRIVLASHADGMPKSVRRTDSKKKGSNLDASAEVVHQALHLAIAKGEIQFTSGGVVPFGFSAGGQMALETAMWLGEACKGVVAIEPTGVAAFPHIAKEFVLGTVADAVRHAWRNGKTLRDDHIAFLREVNMLIRDGWGTPYGQYAKLGHIFATLTPLTALLFNQDTKDILTAGHAFGMRTRLPGPINSRAIDHDATQDIRQRITAPVTIVGVLGAHIVNLLEADRIDRQSLKAADEEITRIRGDKHVLTEDDLTDSLLLQVINDRINVIMAKLFPYSSQTEFVLWQSVLHQSVLTNQGFFNDLVSELKTNHLY